jgi:hypothetical protein
MQDSTSFWVTDKDTSFIINNFSNTTTAIFYAISFNKYGDFYTCFNNRIYIQKKIDPLVPRPTPSTSTTVSSTIINNISPSKDLTSNNQSSFAMYRQIYFRTNRVDTTLVNNSKYSTLQNQVQKKCYGNSSVKDSTGVIEKRVRNALGNNSFNENISYTETKNVNTITNALSRVRNTRSSGIAKKGKNYPNASIF